MYDADTATALLFPKVYLRNNGNTTIPAAELDLEKEGRCSDVKTQQPQQTKTSLCFPAKVLW